MLCPPPPYVPPEEVIKRWLQYHADAGIEERCTGEWLEEKTGISRSMANKWKAIIERQARKKPGG